MLVCGYKLVQKICKSKGSGPFLQGLAKPVHDLSRGCSASDIVDVVVVTASEGKIICNFSYKQWSSSLKFELINIDKKH